MNKKEKKKKTKLNGNVGIALPGDGCRSADSPPKGQWNLLVVDQREIPNIQTNPQIKKYNYHLSADTTENLPLSTKPSAAMTLTFPCCALDYVENASEIESMIRAFRP